jgi:glycosyltransferase involved in cell wall biosynthesis
MVPGTDLIRMNDILDNARIAQYPAIPEANSSCFAVTRRCVANIGFLDEMFEYVPAAITDYALSAKKNGLDVVCVDNLLVYRYDQPKSTDFSSADIQTSESILRHRWEKELKIVQKAISAPVLDDFQKRHGGMDVKPTGTPRRSLKSGDTLHILCVLPTLNPYGGVVSVLNLLNCLMQKGHLCTLVSLSKPQTLPQPFYAQPVSQTEWGDIHKTMNGTYDILLATSWETAEPIAKLAESGCGFPYYFIQGIEQVFYPPEDIRRQAVRDTYSRIDIKFVKTYYLQNAFRDMGFDVHKIRPGMNLDMFYPYGKPDDDILRLLAMVRLGHAYRGDDLVFATLEKIKVLKPDVEIILFGSNELSKLEVPFPFVDMGRVSPDALPPIYSKADVYMDLSREHGFGRTGVEAMACGTACVLSESGGISDYARHQDNALIVPVEDTDAATAAVIRLLEDKELRFHLIQNGLETVKGFDDRDAAEDFLQVVYRTHPAFRQ